MKVQANFEIDAKAKEKAYAVFKRLGIKPTDTVNMFIHHVAMYGELPFHPRIPNEETWAARRGAMLRFTKTSRNYLKAGIK